MIIKGKAAVSRSINLHIIKHLHLIICTSGMQKNRSPQMNQLNKICIIYYNKETLLRQKGPFTYDYI